MFLTNKGRGTKEKSGSGMWGFIRNEGGGITTYLALSLLVVVGIGTTEIGRVIHQASAVEKGVRAAARYAARSEFPLSAAVLARVENIVKTGDPAGGSRYLASGWARADASVRVQELIFDVAGSPLPVVRISATVPYDPMLARFLPVPAFNIELSHDQAFIGD